MPEVDDVAGRDLVGSAVETPDDDTPLVVDRLRGPDKVARAGQDHPDRTSERGRQGPVALLDGQPRIPGISLKTRFRHYVNIGRTEQRLDALLRDFRWGRMDDIFLPDASAGRTVAAN